MNFTLTFGDIDAQLSNAFAGLADRPQARRQVLGAMAATFKFLVIQNLGATGTDRPHEWKQLDKDYAKRVGREYPTLYLTQEEVSRLKGRHSSGQLWRSVRLTVNDDYAEVFADPALCKYAARHQWGEDGMPPRPYFPMTETALTPQAELAVIAAAMGMLELTLQKNYSGPIY